MHVFLYVFLKKHFKQKKHLVKITILIRNIILLYLIESHKNISENFSYEINLPQNHLYIPCINLFNLLLCKLYVDGRSEAIYSSRYPAALSIIQLLFEIQVFHFYDDSPIRMLWGNCDLYERYDLHLTPVKISSANLHPHCY